jgi:hypothetical protein
LWAQNLRFGCEPLTQVSFAAKDLFFAFSKLAAAGQGCQMAYFKTKNRFLGKFLMEDVGMFHGHLVLLKSIWYILWPFGKCNGYLVYFSHFGMLYPEKSGNPAARTKHGCTYCGSDKKKSPTIELFSSG